MCMVQTHRKMGTSQSKIFYSKRESTTRKMEDKNKGRQPSRKP